MTQKKDLKKRKRAGEEMDQDGEDIKKNKIITCAAVFTKVHSTPPLCGRYSQVYL